MRTTLFRAFAIATSYLITLAGPVQGGPVQWPVNGHFYDVVLVPGTLSWEDANLATTAAGGYLATITSSAENAFVFSLANNPTYWHGYSGPWLGGYQDPATQQPNANWRWVTGESWTYTNWQAGQPNHSGSKAEDRLQFGFGSRVPVWNDIMSIDPTPDYRPIAYVVEWDHDPFAPTLEVRRLETASQVELCWQTANNRFYQLQYSSTGAPNEWVPLSANWASGDGTRRCEVDTLFSGNTSRFYRLLCTNAPPP